MLSTFRPALALALALSLALLSGCGSGGDSETSESGLPKEIVIGAAIAKSGYLVPYDANIAAIEQLVKETNARGGIDGAKISVTSMDNYSVPQRIDQFGPQKTWEANWSIAPRITKIERETDTADDGRPAVALEAKPHPAVMGLLSYRRDDHLPSGSWYYEYPDLKPKLLKRIKPAYMPNYEQ